MEFILRVEGKWLEMGALSLSLQRGLGFIPGMKQFILVTLHAGSLLKCRYLTTTPMLLVSFTHLSGPWSDLTSSTSSSSLSIWMPFLVLLCIFLSIALLTFCLALKVFVLVFHCSIGASEMPRPYVTPLLLFFFPSTALHICLLLGRCLINIYWVEITQVHIAG